MAAVDEFLDSLRERLVADLNGTSNVGLQGPLAARIRIVDAIHERARAETMDEEEFVEYLRNLVTGKTNLAVRGDLGLVGDQASHMIGHWAEWTEQRL